MDDKIIDMEQQIIDAAEKLFMEKGFALTSTTEIAKIVGCNQALVHYYFRKKEILFNAIFEKKIKLFVSTFMQISEENISFEEKLKRKIELHFDMLIENQKLPFLILNELITNPDRIKSLREKIGGIPESIYGKMEQELKAEIDKGKVRQMEVIDLLVSILSLNAMFFLIQPIFKVAMNMSDDDYNALIQRRRAENVKTILNSIKP